MENGAILDGQITASSQRDENHAPFQGRLHFQASGRKQGSWVAAKGDLNQWLQVDLGSQFTKVSRVGAVVRALAVHQCVPGSIPGPGVICGLSLLVLYSAPRGFSPGTPVFPSPQKPTFDLIYF